MSFKKIHPKLQEALDRMGFSKPLPFQKELLPKIKSGASIFGIAPQGAGKTNALIMGTLQKLECAAFEDAPRALIFVKDKAAALALEDEFKKYTLRTDLRVYSVYEENNIEAQRNEIFEGVDIVIATPKRLNKIFYLNGINLGKLKLFIVEDSEFLKKANVFSELVRTPQSLERCQYLIFSTKFDDRMVRMQDLFMANAQVIEME